MSSTCSLTQSSSSSETSVGGETTMAHQGMSPLSISVPRIGVAVAALPKEESLYGTLLCYSEEQASDSDEANEYYRNSRQQRTYYNSSGLASSVSREPYIPHQEIQWQQPEQSHQTRQLQQQYQQVLYEDRKHPARKVSEIESPPSMNLTPYVSSFNNSVKPAPGSAMATPKDHSRDEQRAYSRNKQHSSFYREAIADAVSREGSDEFVTPNPRDEKLLSPTKSKKPGIFQVKEPAIRSNSPMYVDAYGENNTISSMASIATDEEFSSPPMRQQDRHHYRTNSSWRSPQDHQSNQSGRQLPNFSQRADPLSYQSTVNEYASTSRHNQRNRQGHNLSMPMVTTPTGSQAIKQAHPALRQDEKRTSASLSCGPKLPNKVQQMSHPWPQEQCSEAIQHVQRAQREYRMSDQLIDPISHFRLQSKASTISLPPASNKRRLQDSRNHDASQFEELLFGRGNVAQPTLTTSSATPRRPSEANNPLMLMDFGSDDHIRNTREMERHRNAGLVRAQGRRDSSCRGTSPTRSVCTTISNPNPASSWTPMPSFHRRTSGHSVHSAASSQSNEDFRFPVTPGPASSSTHSDDSVKHPRKLPPKVLQHDNGSDHLGNHPLHHQKSAPVASQRNALLYPQPTNDVPGKLYRNPGNSLHRHDIHSPTLKRNGTNSDASNQVARLPDPNCSNSRYTSSLVVESPQIDEHQRDSATPNDEELQLALQLSLHDANVSRHASSDSPFNPSLPMSDQRVEPSQLGNEAFRLPEETTESSDVDELMLALRISAKESCLASHTGSQSFRPGSSTPNVIVHLSEQQRILEQIREEKERKDLEMALKASKEEKRVEAESHSVSSNHLSTGTSRSIQDDASTRTRDFLLSQQRALEEYQRDRAGKKSSQQIGCGTKAKFRLQDVYRENLLVKGAMETQRAISAGQAHTVICRKCGASLHAPMSYSLVYCPMCETVSPA